MCRYIETSHIATRANIILSDIFLSPMFFTFTARVERFWSGVWLVRRPFETPGSRYLFTVANYAEKHRCEFAYICKFIHAVFINSQLTLFSTFRFFVFDNTSVALSVHLKKGQRLFASFI